MLSTQSRSLILPSPCRLRATSQASLEDRQAHCCDVLCSNAYSTRQAVRLRYHMDLHPTLDCFLCACCHCCMVSQTSREMALRRDNAAADHTLSKGSIGFGADS